MGAGTFESSIFSIGIFHHPPSLGSLHISSSQIEEPGICHFRSLGHNGSGFQRLQFDLSDGSHVRLRFWDFLCFIERVGMLGMLTCCAQTIQSSKRGLIYDMSIICRPTLSCLSYQFGWSYFKFLFEMIVAGRYLSVMVHNLFVSGSVKPYDLYFGD